MNLESKTSSKSDPPVIDLTLSSDEEEEEDTRRKTSSRYNEMEFLVALRIFDNFLSGWGNEGCA